MAHLSKEEIEELARRFATLGKRDTEFEETSSVDSSDIVAIVKGDKNKKITISNFFSELPNIFNLSGYVDERISNAMSAGGIIGSALAEYVKSSGGTFSGTINFEGRTDFFEDIYSHYNIVFDSGQIIEMDEGRITGLLSPVSNTEATNKQYVDTEIGALDNSIRNLSTSIGDIQEVIPSAASSSNKLADKEFVNSSIATSTATFRGTSPKLYTESTFLEWANAISSKDANDYVFWWTEDAAGNTVYKRYKYTGSGWLFEYDLNNSSFTAAQWAAINSLMTSALTGKLVELPTAQQLAASFNAKQNTLVSGENIKTINNQSLLGSGNIEIQGGGGTDNLFIAEYAVTRVSDIIDAYNAGKDIVAKRENGAGGYDFYQLLGYNDSAIQFDFYAIDDSTIKRIYIVDQGGETAEEEWGIGITTNLNKSDIFWATYNLTTLAQVQSAINSGKLVFVKVDGIALHCPGITSDVAVFTSFVLGYGYISVSLNSNGWEQAVLTNPEYQNNKVISIGPASSNIQYPSAKAVYDALSGKQNTINTVNVSVSATTGTPSGTASVSGSTMNLSFSGIKGEKGDTGATGPQGPQGNTGSSVDYPFELVDNLTTDDPTKALSAAQGVVLGHKIDGELGQRSYSVTSGTALNTTSFSNRLSVPLVKGRWYKISADYAEGGTVSIILYMYKDASHSDNVTVINHTEILFFTDKDYPNGIGSYIAAASATIDGTYTLKVSDFCLREGIERNKKAIDTKADYKKPFSNNLFNKDSAENISGKYINNYGAFASGSGYFITHPIYLLKGESITVNKMPSGTNAAFYFDPEGKAYANKKFAGSGNNPVTITNDRDCGCFVFISSSDGYKDALMVNKGSTSMAYEDYKEGVVIYDLDKNYADCVETSKRINDTEFVSSDYAVTQGTALNTTPANKRFYVNMPAGRKLKVTVNYVEGSASAQLVVYFYNGNNYNSFNIINKEETAFKFTKDYDSVGFYISAGNAITDGSASVKVEVQGVDGWQTDKIETIDQRLGKGLVRISDVLYHWLNGEKYPIGFHGDSTTDGVSTTGWDVANSHPAQDTTAGGTGKADYVCELAYPKQLQNLLRAELGSNTLRVYNIGYYGASLSNNKNQLPDIYSDVYADVKMVGIVLGINDRGTATDPADFYSDVVELLVYYVEFFLEKGITPFMVTNQIVTQCGNDPNNSTYSHLYEDYIQTLCNEAKRFVAKKYNLEVIDMNSFGRLLLESSSYAYNDITEDLHFKDFGHKLEAGYLFSQIIPWVNRTDDASKLYFGFNCAKCKTDFRIGSIETVTADKFKIQVNTTQESATNKCIFDAYMFNNSKDGAYSVKYLTPVASGYIVVDSDTANPIQITATEINLGTWDIGLHHIQVYTGASTTVAFKGFLLESIN